MADTNLTQLAYVEEATFGTTPSSDLQVLRITGGQITPSQNTVVSEEIRSDLRAGRPVRTSQMSQGTINTEWSYGTLDDILEGMLMEAWSTNVLVDGTTKKSYTFEDQFTDLDPSLYNIFRGCRISQLSMSLAMDSIVSGSFGVMGATPSLGQSSSAGTGNTAATTTGPWNTVDMVEELSEAASGSTPAALAKVVGVELNMERNLREKRAIGDLNPFDIGVGRLLVTGSIQQYFEDADLITAWSGFTDRLLRVQFSDEANNELLIEIPKLKLTGDLNVENPGVDSDRLVTANFEAYATASDAALIRFTRTPA
jgi:hypothetical protein